MNLQELAANLGLEEDEYKELIELFVDTGMADFRKMESAMADKDTDQVMRSAHTIKGAAGNLGLIDVSETAKIIEQQADSDQMDNLVRTVETLKTQFETIQTMVQA